MSFIFILLSSMFTVVCDENRPEKKTTALFETTIESLYRQLSLADKLDFKAFEYAMIGYLNLYEHVNLQKNGIVTIIDFSKPSNEKRLFVFDFIKEQVLFSSLVAHGRYTGENEARRFSNSPGSLQSSLGFFVTAETYDGQHGYSLRLKGLDPSFNDNAEKRAIVFHGADYVSEDFIQKYGRLGRSFGCPALPLPLNKPIIDTIKDGTVLFIYYPDREFLKRSLNLNIRDASKQLDKIQSSFLQRGEAPL